MDAVRPYDTLSVQPRKKASILKVPSFSIEHDDSVVKRQHSVEDYNQVDAPATIAEHPATGESAATISVSAANGAAGGSSQATTSHQLPTPNGLSPTSAQSPMNSSIRFSSSSRNNGNEPLTATVRFEEQTFPIPPPPSDFQKVLQIVLEPFR